MNKYLVYCHTSPSGKKYIGLTNNYNRRCIEHKSQGNKSKKKYLFHTAIAKYGWESFKHEIILNNLSLSEANELEEFLISESKSLAPNGYNLQTGGDAQKPSSFVVQKDQKGSLNCMAKRYLITDPSGYITEVFGELKYYCKEKGLSYDMMLRCANPNYTTHNHKGYSCKEFI